MDSEDMKRMKKIHMKLKFSDENREENRPVSHTTYVQSCPRVVAAKKAFDFHQQTSLWVGQGPQETPSVK